MKCAPSKKGRERMEKKMLQKGEKDGNGPKHGEKAPKQKKVSPPRPRKKRTIVSETRTYALRKQKEKKSLHE